MAGSGLAAPAPILAAIMYQYSVAVSHPSKRLYVDSAIALDASSGKLRRNFQPIPDDFYDWSAAATIERFAAEVVPRTRELVAAEREAAAA